MSTNIIRQDLKTIASLVSDNAKVLDIGCEEGQLLQLLNQKHNVAARGMDIEASMVSKCLQQGLSVIQGDADTDLAHYPDQCFDYVVSSQMLQATKAPKHVLQEMIRISKYVIISIPNFGHWYNRYYLSLHGRMPVSSQLAYQWYETPNIHFCTAKDFKALCKELNHTIIKTKYIGGYGALGANLLAKQAVFLIKSHA